MSRGCASEMARVIACGAFGDLFVAIRAKAFLHLRDDRFRIFLPRIVGSDDAEIGILVGRRRHQRALLPVAISAASEDDDQLARRKFTKRLQHV